MHTPSVTLTLLEKTLRSQLKVDESLFNSAIDEEPSVKGGRKVWRLRFYPKESGGFWNKDWCFYEIGTGSYRPQDGESWNVGGVGLFSAVRQKRCGAGRYETELRRLLAAVRSERATDFTLITPGDLVDGVEKPWFFLQRRFQGKDFAAFPVENAATDACWLIERTFPSITRMLHVE